MKPEHTSIGPQSPVEQEEQYPEHIHTKASHTRDCKQPTKMVNNWYDCCVLIGKHMY